MQKQINVRKGTIGGQLIRQLREEKDWSQTDLAFKATDVGERETTISTNTISRIETGITNRPREENLFPILEALGLEFWEKIRVFQVFGYVTELPRPDDEEIKQAIQLFNKLISDIPYPAYLLDCSLRIHTWNSLLPIAFNIDDIYLSNFKGNSLAAFLYDAEPNLISKFANRVDFEEGMRRAFPHVLWPFRRENWIADVERDFISLRLGQDVFDEADEVIRRPMSEMHIQTTHDVLLRFTIIREMFTRDERFRIIYMFPVDNRTRSYLE